MNIVEKMKFIDKQPASGHYEKVAYITLAEFEELRSAPGAITLPRRDGMNAWWWFDIRLIILDEYTEEDAGRELRASYLKSGEICPSIWILNNRKTIIDILNKLQ